MLDKRSIRLIRETIQYHSVSMKIETFTVNIHSGTWEATVGKWIPVFHICNVCLSTPPNNNNNPTLIPPHSLARIVALSSMKIIVKSTRTPVTSSEGHACCLGYRHLVGIYIPAFSRCCINRSTLFNFSRFLDAFAVSIISGSSLLKPNRVKSFKTKSCQAF